MNFEFPRVLREARGLGAADDFPPHRCATTAGKGLVTMSELTEREFAIEMGRRLRQLRSQVGMTQIELGRRVGVHRNTIRNLEVGQGAASAWVAERCAVALAVPIRALVPRVVPKTRVVGEAAQ